MVWYNIFLDVPHHKEIAMDRSEESNSTLLSAFMRENFRSFRPAAYYLPALHQIMVVLRDVSYCEKYSPFSVALHVDAHRQNKVVGFGLFCSRRDQQPLETRSVPLLLLRALKRNWEYRKNWRRGDFKKFVQVYRHAFWSLLIHPAAWTLKS